MSAAFLEYYLSLILLHPLWNLIQARGHCLRSRLDCMLIESSSLCCHIDVSYFQLSWGRAGMMPHITLEHLQEQQYFLSKNMKFYDS
jgi:hypothetical protein